MSIKQKRWEEKIFQLQSMSNAMKIFQLQSMSNAIIRIDQCFAVDNSGVSGLT